MKPDFAKQWLDFIGVKVYSNGHRILKCTSKVVEDITPLDSHILVGQQLVDPEDETTEMAYKIISLPMLERLGYTVVRKDDLKWYSGQRGYYRMTRKKANTPSLGYSAIRKTKERGTCKIQHDPRKKRVRLVGKNVWGVGRVDSQIGEWNVYGSNPHTQGKFTDMSSSFWNSTTVPETTKVSIPEVPFMITEENYILCIPPTVKPGIIELPRLLVVGKSGKGKSWTCNSLASRLLWKYEYRVAYLLDPLSQMQNLSLPQDEPKFIDKLAKVGEEPKPLPIVHFYLACDQLTHMAHADRGISFKLTVDIEDLLIDYYRYFGGLNEYKLSSERYLGEFRQAFKNMNNKDQIKNYMYEQIEGAHKNQGVQQMIFKYTATFGKIFQEKFTSNMYKNDPLETHEWTIETPEYKLTGHPYIMAMEAGLIPVLNVEAAKHERWFRNYVADLIGRIMHHQASKPKDEQKPIFIVGDEISDIYELGRRMDKAGENLEKMYRQCRVNKMGIALNTQDFAKLPEAWKKNCTHLLCVNIQDPKERESIRKTFGLEPEEAEELGTLRTFEMAIISSEDTPWVLYDRWGRKIKNDGRRMFRGFVLPPIVQHYVPKKGG